MSLNWNIDRIANYETVCRTPNADGTSSLSTATEGLIWATLLVGMNGITEKNAAQFYSRLAVWESLNGAIRSNATASQPYTVAEVRAHIGLGTNATNETDARWRKRIMERALVDARRDFAFNLD